MKITDIPAARVWLGWSLPALVLVLAMAACRLPALNERTINGEAPALRILQVSDLHVRASDPLYEELVKRINEEQPDLLVFTGDLVEDPAGIPFLETYLQGITVDCPRLAILGNWEHWGGIDIEAWRDRLAYRGVQLLVNETREFLIGGRRVIVQGLDDWLAGSPVLEAGRFAPDAANLILAHCPVMFDQALADPALAGLPFLMLSGHTHGGQITLFGQPFVIPEGSGRYVAGLYEQARASLVVSVGVGTSTVPLRLFADPSIELVGY